MERGIPDFMRSVVEAAPHADDRERAEQAVLALNASMMQIYDASLEKFKAQIRRSVPIILAMFNGKGGSMLLYRPGEEVEVAPPVPVIYQLAKSVAHSSMAIYEIAAPYLADPYVNRLWCAPMEAYRTQHHTALREMDNLDVGDEDRLVLRRILESNLAFMDQCLAQGGYTFDELSAFARGTVPNSIAAIAIGANAQVGHWMDVVDGWQNELGDAWESTYAASSTLYVTRQNNILFSVLVQFMGVDAMGSRLLLLETPEFESTPEAMLHVLGRVIADRSLGMTFFRDYFMADYEILSDGSRAAIEREMAKRGRQAVLPPLAPYRSHEWPWKTDPAQGSGPARIEDIGAPS